MSRSSLGFLRNLLFGRARSLADHTLFHRTSLIAVFAWVGLGADGLSSSCYGPEETFRALGAHPHLAVFVALASIVTIAVLCASYRGIIALFPGGGGGYLVASKLLSPATGLVSGSALLVDYVLTITISVASGADALFSLFGPAWHAWKLPAAAAGILFLCVLNLRGTRESVLLWVPVFFVFLGTHAFVILYAVATHTGDLATVTRETTQAVTSAQQQLGTLGVIIVVLKAYSLGAGTYTGIEAVSNGLPVLREPRVRTGQRTMLYMGTSLAFTAGGLLLAYLLLRVAPVDGKTLNAVLLERLTASWPATLATVFVGVTLVSEAALLLIAAQAGFIDGPRVAANLALDRWLPARFAQLSDRFVTRNGILVMAGAALLVLLITGGSVTLLVVLYAINVFITFSLSQLGMVVHAWRSRRSDPRWRRGLALNGFALVLTTGILLALAVLKFHDGAWATLLATGTIVAAAFAIRRHYRQVGAQLRRLDVLVTNPPGVPTAAAPGDAPPAPTPGRPVRPATTQTAIVFVNGFNGLGLHTLLHLHRQFPGTFGHHVFVSVGAVDAGNFKGAAELDALRTHTAAEAARYVAWARTHGWTAEARTAIGHDVTAELVRLALATAAEHPRAVGFAGQLVFARETFLTRWLHSATAFALQRQLFLAGVPCVVLPIRADPENDPDKNAPPLSPAAVPV